MNRWFSNQWKPIRSLWKTVIESTWQSRCSLFSYQLAMVIIPNVYFTSLDAVRAPAVGLTQSQTNRKLIWTPGGYSKEKSEVLSLFFFAVFFWMFFFVFFFTSVYSELNGPFFLLFLVGLWHLIPDTPRSGADVKAWRVLRSALIRNIQPLGIGSCNQPVAWMILKDCLASCWLNIFSIYLTLSYIYNHWQLIAIYIYTLIYIVYIYNIHQL